MRVLFIGSVEFSYKILEKLISIDSEIVGVCTKKTSPFNGDFFDLKPLCDLNSIPCCYINDINSKENIEWVKFRKPDIIFCFGWSALIKKELLSIPPMGVIGYHPTKLPKNRGRHPLIWPFILDMTTSASTFFFMNKGADDGDILSQVDFEILYKDDARSIYDKVVNLAEYRKERNKGTPISPLKAFKPDHYYIYPEMGIMIHVLFLTDKFFYQFLVFCDIPMDVIDFFSSNNMAQFD